MQRVGVEPLDSEIRRCPDALQARACVSVCVRLCVFVNVFLQSVTAEQALGGPWRPALLRELVGGLLLQYEIVVADRGKLWALACEDGQNVSAQLCRRLQSVASSGRAKGWPRGGGVGAPAAIFSPAARQNALGN